MRILSLKRRILLYFLLVPFGTFITAGILTVLDMYKLDDFAARTGSDIVNDASQESFLLMLKRDRMTLQTLAEEQATICQLQMRRALSNLDDLETLYRDITSGKYHSVKPDVERFDINRVNINENFTYINYPSGLSEAQISSGLSIFTMLRNAFKFLCAYDDYYAGMEIVFPNGMLFKYDWFPVPLGYDARRTNWFKRAVAAKGEVIWLNPARSETSNTLLLTCAKAVMINGKVDAVFMINILPSTISNEFVVTRSTDSFAFIVTPETLVAREDLTTKRLVWDLSEQEKDDYRKYIISKMDVERKGFFTTVFNGERMDVAYYPLAPRQFIIGVAVLRRKVNEKAGNMLQRVEREKNLYISSSKEYIEGKILLYLGIGFVVSVFMLLFAVWAAWHIGKPISQLEVGVKRLGERKLTERITVNSNDEFQELGETFNAMAAELGNQIKNLRDNIAHQERARHEIAVASEIQKSMLPDASLTFPEHDEFDIYAEMHPAREVGGDFYDFFFVDPKHLFFTVGDISGKGFSAALFMMRTLTLLRHEAEEGLPPNEIFINVSDELCHNNDSCMFFSGICGLLNISDGEVILCNAGHPLPYLRQGRNFEQIKMGAGIVVGPLRLENKNFAVKRLVLAKGDTLFLYTDGVTEAFNPQKAEFQSERLRNVLLRLSGANPHEIINGVSRAVTEFTQGAPQSDDITMLAIKYYA